ncbi:ABC transporter ATP-binding protein [Clostridium sp. CM028]|uniref:ABC transporter ATP-binding protein n=1 Tax=Clostridium sp. CM028 TaxID=2851575 RepID=UPI001C6ECD1E|nr:ABC transporter ATP-binding protein [Clostridium sp. CM028]MBW9147641.1 ABC transporter ATP-binding protein [Clostridium sp. CM028]WLC61971.1 ABC transporter ATP-binding protein [Clostridium sp. CM028]
MSIIEINNVTKRYEDKLVVDSINLNIEKGELFGLVGPNGAGKSTLISMICGLLKADRGDIKIFDNCINKKPVEAKRHIGFIPQEVALYENLNAYDNLVFWGSMYGLKGSTLKNRIKEVLEATGLTERSKDKVKKYSGGMKRRLNIAAAIMHHPDIIIMDEPTVGIDPQSRNHILEFTKNLNSEYGTTVIYTSHYMEEVESLCNRIAIIDEGRVVASGTKDEIKRMVTNEEKLEIIVENFKEEIILKLKRIEGVKRIKYSDPLLIFTVENSQRNLQDIIIILMSSSVRINNISVDSPNLETVFLSLTGKNLRD